MSNKIQALSIVWLLTMPVRGIGADFSSSADNNPKCRTSSFSIRLDNDLFGGRGQDQGYTGGTYISSVSPSSLECSNHRTTAISVGALAEPLDWLFPEEYLDRDSTFSLFQGIYTPEDAAATAIVPDDQPYTGILLVSMGRNARLDTDLISAQFQLGVAGPLALGKQTQDLLHRTLGNKQFMGWDNQLHNEPLFNFFYAHGRRWPRIPPSENGKRWDLIGHWSYAAGNLKTNLGAGAEFRSGRRIPDDFGVSLGGTPSDETGRLSLPPRTSWSIYFFLSTDYWLVIRDITLDGNAFRDSHRVDKQPFVAQIGFGLAIKRGRWRASIGIFRRTREFEHQRETPAYGTITITCGPPAHP